MSPRAYHGSTAFAGAEEECAQISLPSYGRGKNMHHDFFLTRVIIYLNEITSHNPSTLKAKLSLKKTESQENS
jgi:hypothetical protein